MGRNRHAAKGDAPRVATSGPRRERQRVSEANLAQAESDADCLRAREQTQSYLPDALPVPVSQPAAAGPTGRIEIRLGTTLSVTRQLHAEHPHLKMAALNFASAKNPGGGFLRGASAQEESLCRHSGLFVCIRDNPAYGLARRDNRRALYHDFVIYSPAVPVYRDDVTGALLDEPYQVDFLTCPAINAGVARERGVTPEEILEALTRRIDAVLSVAATQQVEILVLGAFGCGVFKNDPVDVAKVFADLLHHKYAGAFPHVVFGIPSERNTSNLDAFVRHFPLASSEAGPKDEPVS
ncbi:uncharacterized protein MONBRDRAFT_24150 [Monosiga brevicollis MX1]|uniref:Microbial-type PARG catalytic domain-containing protein n=1 Tax=Monosiga brevicollis TaxID=81824 RepID=A9UVI9_MONBE|nr:uncharacterized protein MONBRDRAFT_24150 [Monosiga brevicollis MX1]EDQ90589.1 predicted protein [Monosiga brevicollis MX1]|eukprot:XP_001744640.1 hypothetical protein [Monosiga brevicollis MX1]